MTFYMIAILIGTFVLLALLGICGDANAAPPVQGQHSHVHA
jgi:hypothetical protein